jgi:hypothetical protein
MDGRTGKDKGWKGDGNNEQPSASLSSLDRAGHLGMQPGHQKAAQQDATVNDSGIMEPNPDLPGVPQNAVAVKITTEYFWPVGPGRATGADSTS